MFFVVLVVAAVVDTDVVTDVAVLFFFALNPRELHLKFDQNLVRYRWDIVVVVDDVVVAVIDPRNLPFKFG